MKTTTTSATALASAANVHALVKEAFDAVGASFERFCLMAVSMAEQKGTTSAV